MASGSSQRRRGPRVWKCSALLLLPLLLSLWGGAWSTPRSLKAQTTACGRLPTHGRIMGGVPAPEKKWPWQVSVQYGGLHICGGSILNEYWILSAAHCFWKLNTFGLDIYVGLINLKVASENTQWFEVNKVIFHPTYQLFHPVGGDIAVVQLKSRIEFSDSVSPVCLAPANVSLQSNLTCWATGWGLYQPNGTPSETLQEAQFPLIPMALCAQLHGHPLIIQPDMLCAGKFDDIKTVCQGDSGGPLVCEFDHTWRQIGVVSWGRGCSYPVFPAVYARVSYFVDWIYSEINIPPPPQPTPSLSSALGANFSIYIITLVYLSVL